ncbi:MAG: hypothetical protein H6581_05280 [Bacteroidia bacterium]|nr:hypothetical protein [Bacteroidia bacterium]
MIATQIDTNPFPGLRPFDKGEEHLYFGTEKQIDELIIRLRDTRFLAVVGTSGSGKSSLIRAGLLPSLFGGNMISVRGGWSVCIFRPGENPIGNLAEALASEDLLGWDQDGDSLPTFRNRLEATLRRSDKGLVEATKKAKFPHDENLLIVVDQFEELFRFRENQAIKGNQNDSIAFVKLLLNAHRQTGQSIYVVVTMRSDFIGDCVQFEGLPHSINQGQYLVRRMTREECKLAITGPVSVGGAKISNRLVQKILNDVGDNPDQLPIMQHALMRTWAIWANDHDPEEPMDLRHYEAAGTMEKALSIHADEAFDKLASDQDDHMQTICEKMFKGLTKIESEGRGIRRPATLGELMELSGGTKEEIYRIVKIFQEDRRSFLMLSEANDQGEEHCVIDISHESLMRVWERLIAWVIEESKAADLYLRLSSTSKRWDAGKSGLLENPDLESALIWWRDYQPNATRAKRYDPAFELAQKFLEKSKEVFDNRVRREKERQERRIRRNRNIAIFVALAAVFGFMLAAWAFIERNEAKAQKDRADINAVRADSAKDDAIIQRDIAEMARIEADTAKLKAIKNEGIAKKSREISDILRLEAIAQRTIAKKNEEIAILNEEEAQRQKNKADTLRDEAKLQRDNAIIAQERAETNATIARRLRNLAESRNRSFDAIRLLNENRNQKSALEAMEAHKMNRENLGPRQNKDNYEALSLAASALGLKERAPYDQGSRVMAIAVHPSRSLVASGDLSGETHLLDITAKISKVGLLKTGEEVRSLAYSESGKYLAAGTATGSVVVWAPDSPGNNKPVAVARVGGIITSVAIIGTESTPFLMAAGKDLISLFRLNDSQLELVATQPVLKLSKILAVNGGNQLFVSSGTSITLFENQLAKGLFFQNPRTIETGKVVNCLAWSPERQYLAAGLGDGSVFLRNLVTGKTFTFSLHKTRITGIDLNLTDGVLQLATGSLDRTADLSLIGDEGLMEGEDNIILKGHDNWIYDLKYDHSGNYLITAGADQKVRKWEVRSDDLEKQIRAYLSKTNN